MDLDLFFKHFLGKFHVLLLSSEASITVFHIPVTKKEPQTKNLSKTSIENKVLPKQKGIIRLNIYIHFYCYTCNDGSEGSPDDKRVPEQP